jgi:hypothetical protein
MKNDRDQTQQAALPETPQPGKQRWEKMRVQYVGHIGDILRQGGGKLTATTGDPGESRKQKPVPG